MTTARSGLDDPALAHDRLFHCHCATKRLDPLDVLLQFRNIITITIHLLGLAPAGWVAAPDKCAQRAWGMRPNVRPIMRYDGCHAVPLNPLLR
jgi:hypothetical protein